jgi:hypothetical protein
MRAMAIAAGSLQVGNDVSRKMNSVITIYIFNKRRDLWFATT